ncbi:MAG: hypothetical protein PHE05_02125 [Bacilli bacterium]|nr:hypothetical protein [Bacilli bacterium]
MKRKFGLFLSMLFIAMIPFGVKADSNIGGGGEYNGNDCGSASQVCYSMKLARIDVAQGIRITIVDQSGNIVSGTRSVDYLNDQKQIDVLNTQTYFKQYTAKRHKNARLKSSDSTKIGSYTGVKLGDFNDFIDKGTNSIIVNYFKGLNEFGPTADDPGIKKFYDDCGYDYDTNFRNKNIQNHYLLVEPFTYMRVTDRIKERATHYVGSVTDIAKMMKADGYVLWSGFFGTMLPLSIYTRDNPKNGAKSTAGLVSIQAWVDNKTLTDYSAEILTVNGTAAGHVWLPELPPKKPECDLNDPTDFPTSKTDTDRKCCEIIEKDLAGYNITKDELYQRYPVCDVSNDVTPTPPTPPCTFTLDINIPNSCNVRSEGYVKDTDDWECIFNSRSSSENDVRTHFFSWENQYCSFYCREEVAYQFPGKTLEVLAGNRFTLGDIGYFPNLAPIHFVGTSECRPTSDSGGIDWKEFESDWESANINVKDTWDDYQVSLKKDYGADHSTKKRSSDCGCVYSTSHNDCCTREKSVYHKRTCYSSCRCKTVDGKTTCDSCPYDCSYYTYPCTSPNNTYHYKYYPSTVYYNDGSGNANVTPSPYCNRPDYGTSRNRSRYQSAVQHLNNLENAITKCNDWERDYTEFDPDVMFRYEEDIYGGRTYRLINELDTSTRTNYYINNVSSSSINRYKRTKTTYRYVCNTTGSTCRKGSSVGGSRYVYPTNDWLKQFTVREYEYGLPYGVYEYISKPDGESHNTSPGGNYYHLGYSSLPVHYSRKSGWYDFELDYNSFGNNHKFNKYIFGNSKINIDYGANTELYKFLQDNNLMQYINQCASRSANCSSLSSTFYRRLRDGGQLSNFLNSDCAKNSFCRVSGSRIVCGTPRTFTYRGFLSAGTRMYISSNWYWYYNSRMEVWNNGYQWWVRNGSAWDYLSRRNEHDRYYPDGDYYDKYTCYSIEYGGQCVYKGRFYAPPGALLDGKESPSNFSGDNVYARLQSCLVGNDTGSTPTDAFNGRTRYECQYRVENEIVCPVGSSCDYVGLSVIFRPIDLADPFPGLSGSGRRPGTNWNNSSKIDRYITNNRGVETGSIYSKRDPLYKITLTPAVIREIRKYNSEQISWSQGYADFEMNCITEGEKCMSYFVRYSDFARLFSGCGITSKRTSKCLPEEGW